ncbi:MAG: CRISPR-associated protein Csm7 [Methyloprofundus sp.]|nr:CRISPR-associated protein Csm7 [Methyloprofundus sp.]
MERLIFTLTPKTAFATPLAGDTLFGQCCWAIRHCFGAEKLTSLLAGYTENEPFMVISDAMPHGFLPRPTVPGDLLGFENDTKLRKIQKAKKWLPESVLRKPLNEWAPAALTESEMLQTLNLSGHYCLTEAQDHNSLNRKTGTTGGDSGFSPFQRQTFWYHPEIKLSLIVELDDDRLDAAELLEALQWIGLHGYGKEASCGLGKFEIELTPTLSAPATVKHPNAWLTLASCTPQNLSWHAQRCYYQVLTRFGRHGDMAVHQNGGVFKNPVLMAATGAVLTPKTVNQAQGFIGQGITGVSKTINATVHQGYAPVYPVEMAL